MSSQDSADKGPDFAAGIDLSDLAEGVPLAGHVRGEAAMLVRRGTRIHAVGATCTHYSGPLAQGLVEGDTVRCPWHHACFSLESGEALRAPALNPIPCWQVEQRDGRVVVGEPLVPVPRGAPHGASVPGAVVIAGGGAAGHAAAEMLRREGYGGSITMLSADTDAPYDRPNLSKSYLAGSAPEDWIPLRPPEHYRELGISLELSARVDALDTAARQVRLADGRTFAWDALLLATGADPVRLDIPGADAPHVLTLRSLADCRTLIGRVQQARRAVVVGAGFIGMEAAAALRARGLDVDVVAPDAVPMARVLGPDVGALLRRVHERHGVRFHLGTTPASIDARGVVLKNGETVAADLVLVGVGVRPSIALAQQAGLAVDRGVTVDAWLQTSAPGVWAAGDIARWPDALTGERIRVEHWVVAQRQGQTAARNMLGQRQRHDMVPFFWTEQHDVQVSYVGHAESWTEAQVDGDLEALDAKVTYRRDGRTLAVATIGRDRQALQAEVELERAVAGLGTGTSG
jgi:NADPH-dependent 2,4-dienoyl-CoA reductase/sulfur reductase-like enzyme/nitrite reductase/ring-hydroxylating ferredoxin subunit